VGQVNGILVFSHSQSPYPLRVGPVGNPSSTVNIREILDWIILSIFYFLSSIFICITTSYDVGYFSFEE